MFVSSYNTGIVYEGMYYYVEKLTYCYKEDNPLTQVDDSAWRTILRLAKYNPVTNTVSSLCKNPTCMHSTDECQFVAPNTWLVTKFQIFGDWLLYAFCDFVFTDPLQEEVIRVYLYNLKSGELRQIDSTVTDGTTLNYSSMYHAMNGKIYSTLELLDYSGRDEFEESGGDTKDYIPPTRQYVQVYDPETEETTRLFEISEDMQMVALTNKRIFYKKTDLTFWSSDYSGNNMKQEENINFDLIQLCGKYAYLVENPDYKEVGYNYRVYDLETETISEMDFGCQIREILVDSGKLVFTTFSRIDEFKELYKSGITKIKEMYPDVTDPEELIRLKKQVSNSIEYDGTFQLYITDALGNNKELVFEGENMMLSPVRLAGNYLYARVSYADPNNNFEVTTPGNDGLCALNLETGEITLIPQLELYLD